MAERVVDLFEAINVDEQHSHVGAMRARALQTRRKLIAKITAIRQPGQAVVVGKLPDLVFGMLAVRDVLDHPVHRGDATMLVAIHFGFHVHHPYLAVRPRHAALEGQQAIALDRFAIEHLHTVP